MTGARFRTDYRLWMVAAACLFVAFGFVDPLAGAWWKGDTSLWHEVGIVVRGQHAGGASGALPFLFFYAGLLSAPAVLIGWLVQSVIVIVRASRQGMGLEALKNERPRTPRNEEKRNKVSGM